MRLLFTAQVRPHLEFANCVWSPRFKKDKKLIEGVLRRATKCIPSLNNLEYEERLKALRLPSMSYRRVRGDLIEAYKFMQGRYNCKNPLEPNQQSITRGHQYKFKKKLLQNQLTKTLFHKQSLGHMEFIGHDNSRGIISQQL